MSQRSSRDLALLSVGLALLVGLILRLFHLDEQTFTHPEFYVPALHLPDFVVTPRARFTVPEVLREALLHDKHPPGYHILMLAWNLNVGTEVYAIRLSSVLFGMLALVAIPWFVRVNGGAGFGALAVWLLALHGFQIFWSQQARPWGLIGSLGIVTTALLVSLVRRPRVAMLVGYGLIAGYGMWIDYYFWPIVCAQVLWVVLHELDRERPPLAFGAVALAAIIATPMAIYFWLHLTEQESHIRTAGWQDIIRFLQFGGVVAAWKVRPLLGGFAAPFEILVAALGALAIALGLRPWRVVQPAPPASRPYRSRTVFAILTFAAVAMSAWTWSAFHDLAGDRKIFRAALVAPFAVLAGLALVHGLWRSAAPALAGFRPIRWLRRVLADPVAAVPLAAFAGVMIVATAKPLLAPYALLCFTPFVVVLAARGIERMGRLRVPVATVVLAVFAASVWHYGTTRISSIEYKALGLQLAERVSPGQAIVMRNNWATAPMNYYLPPDRFRIVPISHLPETRPPLRVALPDTLWLLAVGDDEAMLDVNLADVERFVPGFRRDERLSTGSTAALRVIRFDTPPPPDTSRPAPSAK